MIVMKSPVSFTVRLSLVWFLVSLPALCLAGDWSSFIVNYNKSLYGKGAQVWQIASYGDGWTYFANQNGMLQYNGNNWTVFPLNNNMDVRSVLPSNSRKHIYVGGINEFGYFEPGKNGRLVYVCMSDSIPQEAQAIGNVWRIHEADQILYIQGDTRVIKYLNGKYTAIDAGCKIFCSDMVKDVLYLGTERGVMVLVGNTLFPLQGAGLLANKRIRGIIPDGDGVLVVTAYDGLYHCDNNRCVPLRTGVESFLSENEVFCVASTSEQIALGTVHKGIVLIDRPTLAVKYFNENNGLQNNTVLSLAFDPGNNLWAGLDIGIDYVCLNSSLTNLYTYPHSYGTGYDVVLSGDYLYLGTNRGLFYTKYPVVMSADSPDIQPVPHSSGQVWSLQKVGDRIFCMHDRGLYLVEGFTLKRIGLINGAWSCRLVEGTDDKLFVGVYDGLYLLQKRGEEWAVVQRVEGVTDSFRFFEQESPRVLWMSDQNRCTRVELDPTLTKAVKTTIYDENSGLPESKRIRVNKVKGRIYISTPEGIYKYNSESDRMERSDEINPQLNSARPYLSIARFNDQIIGLNEHELTVSNLAAYKRGPSTCTLPLDMSMIELVRGAETFIPLSDSSIVIPNDNGFALASISLHKSRKDGTKSVHIRNVFISYPKGFTHLYRQFSGSEEYTGGSLFAECRTF